MGFFNSAVNQVGRDLGKVVSNELFKNDHASVHRIIKSNEYSGFSGKRRSSVKSDYEKAIAFPLSFRPDTLINKLAAVYIIVKNKLNEYLEDEYLDKEESQEFFEMLVGFHSKVEDIGEVLALDAVKNTAALDKLNRLITNMTVLVSNSMALAARGCREMEEYYLERSSSVEVIGLGKYVGLHLLCMRGYAKGGEKKITRAILRA